MWCRPKEPSMFPADLRKNMRTAAVLCIFGQKAKYVRGLQALLPKLLKTSVSQILIGLDASIPSHLHRWLHEIRSTDTRISLLNMIEHGIMGESRALWRILIMAGLLPQEAPTRYVPMDVDSVDHKTCLISLQRAMDLPTPSVDTAYFQPRNREWVTSNNARFRIACQMCDVVFDVVCAEIWRDTLHDLLRNQCLDIESLFRAFTGSQEELVYLHDREQYGYGVDETVLTQYLIRLHETERILVQMYPRLERTRCLRPVIENKITFFGAC